MITVTTRPFTYEEIKQQAKLRPSAYKRIEAFILKVVFTVFGLLIPLLLYDHFSPVPSHIQATLVIAMVVTAIILAFWFPRKWKGSDINKTSNIHSIQAEVIHVRTSRAIKREDPEDFGVAYYLEVIDNGKAKTLYLWGQYLDVLVYEGKFPNTEFEFIRENGSDEFVEFKTLGKYFKEENSLPAFGEETWKSGKYPSNGQILEQTLDEIK